MAASPNSSTSSQRVALPPVFLNHVYIVLDAVTYRNIESSTFLREVFAITERRMTAMSGKSYTALYVYGANTYLEFFDAANLPSPQMSNSGICLGVDQMGALQAIYKALTPGFLLEEKPTTRQYGENQIPWFYAGAKQPYSGASHLPVWLIEYHPRFLAEWHPQPDSLNEGVSREQILKRYTAILKEAPINVLFQDIIALTIAADEAVCKKLIELTQLLGYGRRRLGNTEVMTGPELELRFIPQKGGRGVQALTLRTKGQPGRQAEFRFGPTSILHFYSEELATWSFA